MYTNAARASGGNEDHMPGYFPLVMVKAPLLWLDNLPAECITSRATLSWLSMTSYQVTYNRHGKTHHLARVWIPTKQADGYGKCCNLVLGLLVVSDQESRN
jgi:hypothetical protein